MPHDVHTALQQHYAGASGRTEAVIEGFRVDVYRDGVAYEIQTGSFRKIRDKLSHLAERVPLVIVYPVADVRTIVRVDTGTGEVLSVRRSPMRAKLLDCFEELRSIAALLARDNVRIDIVKTLERELRPKAGTRRRGRGEEVMDRELLGIEQIISLRDPEDYLVFLPQNLPTRFTVADLAQAAGVGAWRAGQMCFVLRTVNAIRQVGKQGNAFVYEVAMAQGQTAPRGGRGWLEVRCSRCNLLACEARRGSRLRWRCQGCGALEEWAARATTSEPRSTPKARK